MNDENDHGFDFNRELERILREFLSGATSETPAISGIPLNPSSMGQIFSLFQQGANQAGGDGIDWSVARKTALEVAKSRKRPDRIPNIEVTFSTASLWLDEVTIIGASPTVAKKISPIEWVQATIDTWVKLAEPVAESITKVLLETFEQQVPEEMKGQLGNFSSILTRLGGGMFAMQLGQVVGKLATEVLSGGDIGIPLIKKGDFSGGSLLPENTPQFLDGIEQPETEVLLFLVARELSYARLFRHARWLESHVTTIIHEYAAGIELDMDHFHDLAIDFDLQNPGNLQDLLKSGALIPPKSPRQEVAHERLETLIALIDGWVDVVTTSATNRLPGSVAIAEMMRRRRATGGPSEKAFANLIGLEMRPRKLREASRMWKQLSDSTDINTRDSLWAHPDLLPTKEEIENPDLLVARVQGKPSLADSAEINFDDELAKILRQTEADTKGTSDGDSENGSDSNSTDDETDD